MVIDNLNVNSTSNKTDNLKLIIHGKVKVLVTTRTKIDLAFPLNQFIKLLKTLQAWQKQKTEVFLYMFEKILQLEN